MANRTTEIQLAMNCNISLILLPSTKVCQNLGWSCPELYEPSMIIYLLFIIIRWILSAFILILSGKIIGHDIIKYFTLNLFAVCILCDVFLAARQFIAVAQFYTTVFHSSQPLILFNALTQLFVDAAAFQYRAMSLFVVFITYLLFVFPFKMRQFLSGNAYKYYFITVHLLTPFACLSRFLIYIIRDQSTLAMLRRYNAVVPYAVLLTVAILLLLITLLAMISLVRRQAMQAEEDVKRRQKNLISFLVYCIPINVMNIPVCTSAIALWMHGILPEQMTSVLAGLRFSCEGELFIVQIRTIIISLSTVIALAPYRRAAIQLLFRKHATKMPFMPFTATAKQPSSGRRSTVVVPSRLVFGFDATPVLTSARPQGEEAKCL